MSTWVLASSVRCSSSSRSKSAAPPRTGSFRSCRVRRRHRGRQQGRRSPGAQPLGRPASEPLRSAIVAARPHRCRDGAARRRRGHLHRTLERTDREHAHPVRRRVGRHSPIRPSRHARTWPGRYAGRLRAPLPATSSRSCPSSQSCPTSGPEPARRRCATPRNDSTARSAPHRRSRTDEVSAPRPSVRVRSTHGRLARCGN
jgi:hypothetical protein